MPLSKHCSNATGNNVMPIYLLDYHICALISYTNTLSYSLSVFLYSLFSFYSLKRRKKKFHIVIFIFFSTLSLSNTQRQMTKWTKCNNAIHIKDVKVAARATQWNRIMCIRVSFFYGFEWTFDNSSATKNSNSIVDRERTLLIIDCISLGAAAVTAATVSVMII